MTPQNEKDELIDSFMVAAIKALKLWLTGKAAIMIGELPVRFKADE